MEDCIRSGGDEFRPRVPICESKSLVFTPHHTVTLKWPLHTYPEKAFAEHGVQTLRYVPGTRMCVQSGRRQLTLDPAASTTAYP